MKEYVHGFGLNKQYNLSVRTNEVTFIHATHTPVISGWGIAAWFNSKFMVSLMSWLIFPIDSHYKYNYT